MRRFIILGGILLLLAFGGQLAAQDETTYVVQPGDTLFRIALNYGSTVQTIATANNIANVNLIFVGQRLAMPNAPSPATPAAPAAAATTASPTSTPSANVGVIVRTDRFKRRGISIETLLHGFVESGDLRRRGANASALRDIATWQLPLAVPGRTRRAFDGAVLVGDAARLVDALTGEGIHNAVVSATLAADTVDNALTAGDVSHASLAAYERQLERQLGRLIRRSYRSQKYVTAFPPVLETLFVLAGAHRGRVTRWLNRKSTDFRVAE